MVWPCFCLGCLHRNTHPRAHVEGRPEPTQRHLHTHTTIPAMQGSSVFSPFGHMQIDRLLSSMTCCYLLFPVTTELSSHRRVVFPPQVLLLEEFEDRICKPAIYGPNFFLRPKSISYYPFTRSRLAHGVDTMEHSTSAPAERCSQLQIVIMERSWERKPASGDLGLLGFLCMW